jgi:hypothetical protein
MNNTKKQIWALIATVMIALLVIVMMISGPLRTSAAPMAAVTPLSFSNNSSRAAGPRLITYFDGTPAAYLTPVTTCYDLRGYNTLDLIYTTASVTTVVIDQLYGNNTTKLAAGAAILASNATPVVTPVAMQIPIFNAYNCVQVTAGNGTPFSVYVGTLAK